MGKEFEPDSAGEIPIHLAFTREMLGKHIAELESELIVRNDEVTGLISLHRKAEHRCTALVEALTPSADTKAAYWGEDDTTTDWTLIKNIMRHIRQRALLGKEGEDG